MKKKIWDLYAPIYKQAMKADQQIYDYMYKRIPGKIRNKEVLKSPQAPVCWQNMWHPTRRA
jgi:hypothetical protein